MADQNDPAALAYIKFVLSQTKMTATALAKEAGVSATTITRPLNNPRYKFNLSATTLQKIADKTGLSFAPFFEGRDMAELSLASYTGEVYDEEHWGAQGGNEDLEATAMIGEVAWGRWNEVGLVDMTEGYPPLLLKPSGYRFEDCFGVRVGDFHLVNYAYPQDALLCIKLSALKNVDRLSNEVVIVERKSPDGRLVELTARKITASRSGWQLNAIRYGDPKYGARLTLKALPGDESTRIIGQVLYVVRYGSLPQW